MRQQNKPITSREYKLILHPARFADREVGADAIWSLIKFLAVKQGGEIVERQNEEKTRVTQYLDTPDHSLRRYGYALRLRKAKKYKLTLKYRGRDRYVAAARDLSAAGESEFKFEEDVLATRSNFAQSTSITSAEKFSLSTMADALSYFPGLHDLKIQESALLQTVADFRAHEVTRWIGKLRFAEEPTVKICLSFWYMTQEHHGIPLVAEFSFDYDLPKVEDPTPNQLESYPVQMVDGTSRFFDTLTKQSTWIDLSGTTKTEFAYHFIT